VKQQVFELSVVTGRADSGQAVNDDLDILALSFLHDSLESIFTAEHLAGRVSASDSERRSIDLTVLLLVNVGSTEGSK